MKYLFAALRFFEDGNISDRAYWYLCDFMVRAGDEVFAPVGMRNRLQKACVERVLSAEEEDAPYDVALCKHVAAKCGDRTRAAGDFICHEMGGVKYDEKRYTAFGRVLVSDETPQTLSVLAELGVDEAVCADDVGDALRALLKTRGRALLYGKEARETARVLLYLARGQEAEGLGLTERERRALAEKLQ